MGDGVVSLTEFLAARLDETEAGAWAVHDVSKCDALLYADLPADAPLPDAADCECGYPARVLREVEAGRAILADHHQEGTSIWCNRCDPGADLGDSSTWYPCRTLRAIAAVWSDHPDYRQEWAPLT